MKNLKNICMSFRGLLTILFILMMTVSCKEQLNIAPLDILTEDQIFQSESGVKAYMASLYDDLPLDSWNTRMINSTDLAMSYLGNNQVNGTSDGTWFNYWGYQSIRRVNEFLELLPDANLTEEKKRSLEGEAKFLRAYYYFGMVIRYGGVPIVDKVLQFTGDNELELQFARNSEKEVWDFIAKDLDEAASLLPEMNEKGRANKYAALALKSRAMLYAGSIAKYGSVELNGILGIPSGEANKYWKDAYDAADSIIKSGAYSLYSQNSDKASNFAELFINTENNPELILTKYYKRPSKTNSYNLQILPYGVRAPIGDGSQIGPTLELVEEFEYIDGSSGELKLENTDGSPIFYPEATDLFENKDPRMLGTIIVPYANYRDTKIEVRAGIYDQGMKVEVGGINALYNPDTQERDDENGTIPIHGNSGLVSNVLESTQTGFYLRKYLDYTVAQAQTASTPTDYIIFRYGEVLLNYAEAAAELNNISDSKEAINKIRARAGIKLLDNNDVTVKKIQHERLVELAFEWHRWWDLKRWRIADQVLDNRSFKKLKPYWDIQNSAYRFEVETLSGRTPKNFSSRVYYHKIPTDIIEKNPKLIQNPGY